jgi:hypothetical protein
MKLRFADFWRLVRRWLGRGVSSNWGSGSDGLIERECGCGCGCGSLRGVSMVEGGSRGWFEDAQGPGAEG